MAVGTVETGFEVWRRYRGRWTPPGSSSGFGNPVDAGGEWVFCDSPENDPRSVVKTFDVD